MTPETVQDAEPSRPAADSIALEGRPNDRARSNRGVRG